MKRILTALLLAALPLRLPSADFAGPEGLVARRVPWLRDRVRFEALTNATGDAFELRTEAGRLVVRATDANAAAEGLGWFLKYSCHRSTSHVGDNLSPVASLPGLDRPVRVGAAVRHRYALNYCTFNYTMSFYSWADWE